MRFGAFLTPTGIPEKIIDPASERFVTVRLRGQGAEERAIGSGKTPRPFTGYRVSAGDFIYSRIDARNGAFAIIPNSLNGAVVSKDFPTYRIDATLIDPDYLMHYCRSGLLAAVVRTKSSGATNRQRIPEDVFLDIDVPLPPLDEQRRIAQVLTTSSRNLALAEKTSSHLLKASTAFMARVIEGTALSQPLETFASIRGGSTPSKSKPNYWNGSIPWFSSKDLKQPTLDDSVDHVTEQALDETSLRPTADPGIAVSIRGMSLAHTLPTSIIPAGSCVNQDLKVFIPVDPEDLHFLFYVLRAKESEVLTKVASSAHGTRRLDVKHIKEVPVPVLSAEKKAEVNERLATIESLYQLALNKSDKLQELHHSLATRAFAGEL